MVPSDVRRDFVLLLASRVCTRMGDGFLRIIGVLLVAAKSKDPLIAGFVLVSRYICEIIINAISGPFVDRLRIRTSLVISDLSRTVLSVLLIASVLLGYSYPVYLALCFLGDFVFIFFKPAVDKVVKVSFPVEEGTKVLSEVDATNHLSNIAGYTLASLASFYLGTKTAVLFSPLFFFLSFLLVFRLQLAGERIIDYKKVRKKSYWASQKEGLQYTWANSLLRTLLISRSVVAIGRGSFTALSVVYLADITRDLSAYGYFESAQSGGKVVATALFIPFLFAYQSSFMLMGISLLVIGVSFFFFNLANDVLLACLIGALLGAGQASEAVAIDACINRYAEAHIQGRAKSTTSFGSRIAALAAIGIVYFLVTAFDFKARTLFGWLGVFPVLGALVSFAGWTIERSQQSSLYESRIAAQLDKRGSPHDT